jgi:hypothetical protein
MGDFEATKGRVGVYADVVWARLGFDRSTAAYRNPIAGLQLSASANAALKYSLTIVEVGGLYEIARWPGSAGSSTALDGVLGFRYWNNSVDLKLDVAATADFSRLSAALGRDVQLSRSFVIAQSGSLDWIDPLVGPRVRHQFTPNQELWVRGDVGGFGFQSNFEMAGGRRLQLRLAVHRLSARRGNRLSCARRQLHQHRKQQQRRRRAARAHHWRQLQVLAVEDDEEASAAPGCLCSACLRGRAPGYDVGAVARCAAQ